MIMFRLILSLCALFLVGCNSTQTADTSENASVIITGEVHTIPEKLAPKAVIKEEKHQQSQKEPINVKELDDVWQRIRHQLTMDIPEHPSVLKRVDWYLKHPNYMEVISQRASPFLYYIVEEVERRGLPLELALIPLFESDFNTTAYSAKHASGLWQLTPLIAKHYKVKIGPWYDGRQDIIDATNAALSFLSYLHKRFDGNWHYAIAAYNAGEGRIARAIANNKRKGLSTEFFALKLPKETQRYLPKLLAASFLLKNKLMAFPRIENTPVIDVVTLNNGVIIDGESHWQSLEKLNPGYRRFPALLDGPNHIVIPKKSTVKWLNYVASLPQMPSEQWQEYTIQRGDSLSRIAKQFDISVAEIKTFNRLSSSRIRAGDTLTLPILADKQIDYTVKAGDSLWRIAKHYQVTIDSIKQWNNLSHNNLRIGDTLTLFLSP